MDNLEWQMPQMGTAKQKMDRWTQGDKQIDTQMNRLTCKQTDGQIDKQTIRQADGHID